MLKIWPVIFLLFISVFLNAQNLYLSDQEKIELQHIYSMQKPVKTNSSFIQGYRTFLDFLTNEQKAQFNSFQDAYEAFENKLNDQPQEEFQYCNLSVQKALILWMTGNEFEGVRAFYKAFRIFKHLDESTSELEFKKLSGLFEVLLAQVPDQYRFWMSLIGMEGDAVKGFKLLEEYKRNVKGEPGLYTEALVMQGYLQLKFGKPDDAFVRDFISDAQRQEAPIITFIAASLAVKNRLNEKALELLSETNTLQFKQFPLLHYFNGRTKLNNLDETSMIAFNDFLCTFKGNSFRADALMRQAWWHHIDGSNVMARDSIMAVAVSIDTLPTSNDRQAIRELSDLENKPMGLLKARLFFDGGYYQEAKQALRNENSDVLSPFYQLEYYYRLGSINESLDRYEAAINSYKKVIELAANDERYYGPYAALKAAKLSLTHCNDTISSRHYIERAKSLNTGAYKRDIAQQIKTLESEY